MFLEAALLVGLWTLPPVAAHRPQKMFSLSLPEGGEGLQQNAHEEEDEFTVTVRQNGFNAYGFHLDPGKGGIQMVFPGSLADIAGLKVGQHIIRVGTKPYTYGTLVTCIKTTSCQVTLAKSKFQRSIAPMFRFLIMTAGFVGALIALSLPWIIRQSVAGGLEAFGRFGHPLMLFMVAVALIGCCGNTGLNMLEWQYASVMSRIHSIENCVGCLGLAGGCLANRHNSLLNAPLHKEQAAALRRACLLALVPLLTYIASHTACAFLQWNKMGSDLNEIYELRYIPEGFLLVIFTSLMAQISIAACQGMADITERLSQRAEDFVKDVHKPCARLLEEVPPNLATCGVPMIVVSLAGMMDNIFDCHRRCALMWSEQSARDLESWCRLAGFVAWCALALCPLVVSLGQLSSGLKLLEAKLNDERMRDQSQHLQVQAVEEMLAEAMGYLGSRGGRKISN